MGSGARLDPRDQAVGDAQRQLSTLWQRVIRHLQVPVSLDPLGSWLDQLADLARDCSTENWDGYGARPLLVGALREAALVLRSLPPGVVEPEIAAEPDGSIGVEWRKDEGQRFAVSLAGIGRIFFSGVYRDGTSERGVEVLGEGFPLKLREALVARFPEP